VHGFRSTSWGVPLDAYGRNVYLDLYNSALGPGWRRENYFLAQMRDGRFRHHLKSGKAERYRVCADRPGRHADRMPRLEVGGWYAETAGEL
jgi:hypothetical protein